MQLHQFVEAAVHQELWLENHFRLQEQELDLQSNAQYFGEQEMNASHLVNCRWSTFELEIPLPEQSPGDVKHLCL